METRGVPRVRVGRRRVRARVGALDAAGAARDRDAAVGVGRVVVVAAEVEAPGDRRAERGEVVPGLVRDVRGRDVVGGPDLQEASGALEALRLVAVDVRAGRERMPFRVAAVEVHERDAAPVRQLRRPPPLRHRLAVQRRHDEPPVDRGLRGAAERLDVDGELAREGDGMRLARPPLDLSAEDADDALRVVRLRPERPVVVRRQGRRRDREGGEEEREGEGARDQAGGGPRTLHLTLPDEMGTDRRIRIEGGDAGAPERRRIEPARAGFDLQASAPTTADARTEPSARSLARGDGPPLSPVTDAKRVRP